MVFDVPTQAHIPSLASAFEESTFYKQFLAAGHANEYTVHSIYHLCGQAVLEDTRYKALLAKFHPDVNVSYTFTVLVDVRIDRSSTLARCSVP